MEYGTLKEYVNSHFGADEEINFALEEIKKNNLPPISIAPVYGRLLTLLVKITTAKNVLEVGCLGGVGSIYLARGLGTEGQVTSLEYDKRHVEVAKGIINKTDYKNNIKILPGEAEQLMNGFIDKKERFDLIFIDADKSSYPVYLKQSIELANPGALIIADNTLIRGKVLDGSDTSEQTVAIRKFNEMVSSDSRLEATMLPGVDGLVIAQVRKLEE